MMPGEDILMKALPFGHIVKFGTASDTRDDHHQWMG